MRLSSWPTAVDEDAFMMDGDSTGSEGLADCGLLSWTFGRGRDMLAGESGDMEGDNKGDLASISTTLLGGCEEEFMEVLRE